MNVKGGLSRRDQQEWEEGQERILRGEEDQVQRNETCQLLSEKGKRRQRLLKKYNGGDELFKVHCTHVWNYHNGSPS
jgi:hypothetical protein